MGGVTDYFNNYKNDTENITGEIWIYVDMIEFGDELKCVFKEYDIDIGKWHLRNTGAAKGQAGSTHRTAEG